MPERSLRLESKETDQVCDVPGCELEATDPVFKYRLDNEYPFRA